MRFARVALVRQRRWRPESSYKVVAQSGSRRNIFGMGQRRNLAHRMRRRGLGLARGLLWLACSMGTSTGAETRASNQRLIGLLEVPELLERSGPESSSRTQPARPQRLSVHASPALNSPVIAVLDRAGTSDAAGVIKCLWWPAAQTFDRCAALEHGYEELSLMVYQVTDEGWFQVALGPGGNSRGWVKRARGSVFRDLPSLLKGSMSYLTPGWTGQLFESPGRQRGSRTWSAGHGGQQGGAPSVRVKSAIRTTSGLWLKVEMLDTWCGESDPPRVLASGWVPAHSASGDLVVWFHSRGC